MPLRDHFHSPVIDHHAWEGFHAQWPAMVVLHLSNLLPKGFTAEPRAHLGRDFEVDVASFVNDAPLGTGTTYSASNNGAAATWAPPQPTATLDAEPEEPSEYEVLVYDAARTRTLVAAIEIVSPANKDRADHRRAFATKCAALIQNDVCVSIVDLVTARGGNLYAETLDLARWTDPTLLPQAPELYAVTCRKRTVRGRPRLQSWAYPLELGRPLPTLPLWLTEDLAIALDLEASYEPTCRVLSIA